MRLARRLFWGLAWVSAVWLLLVGVVLSPFYAAPITQWLGLDAWLVFAVLFALWALHLGPLVGLGFAATGPKCGVRAGGLLLLCAGAPLCIGVYALILRGDWGDALLWVPYLLTGLCLAVPGAARLRPEW